MDENDDELGDEDEDEIITGPSTGSSLLVPASSENVEGLMNVAPGRLRNGANDSRPSPGMGGASTGGGGGGTVILSDKDVQGMTERGIAALQAHGNVSYDQAEALRALLASRVDLPSSPGPSGAGGSGSGGGGGTGGGPGNIDPTLQSLGGHQNGPAGSEAGGVVGTRVRTAAGRDPASLVTSSAQAALAALTQGAYDFPGLSGYK